MNKYQGSLTNADYHLLIEKKHIHSKNFNKIHGSREKQCGGYHQFGRRSGT